MLTAGELAPVDHPAAVKDALTAALVNAEGRR